MKRTPLKRKKGLRKKSKMKISLLQRKIWNLCKEITRKTHGNTCYTCSASNLAGSNWHTGHLWSKASLGSYLKYDLRVLRPQCYNCNINQGGRGADFYARMLKEIGEEKMAELQRDRQVITNAYDHYIKIYEQYKRINETSILPS